MNVNMISRDIRMIRSAKRMLTAAKVLRIVSLAAVSAFVGIDILRTVKKL